MSRLVENRSHFQGLESFDGIAEVVEGKHALFLLGIKDLLKANALLLDERASGNLSKYFRGLTEQLVVAEEVVRRLSVRLHLPDISELGVDQIGALREHMPAFRDKLLGAIGNEELLLAEREAMVERLTDVLIDEFFDYVSEARARKQSGARSTSRVWNLMQLMLSPLLGHTNAHRFFGWLGEPSAAPEMMLMELHNMRRLSAGAKATRTDA